MAERAKAEVKRMRFFVVKNRKKETFHPIIERHVNKNYWIFSDG